MRYAKLLVQTPRIQICYQLCNQMKNKGGEGQGKKANS